MRQGNLGDAIVVLLAVAFFGLVVALIMDDTTDVTTIVAATPSYQTAETKSWFRAPVQAHRLCHDGRWTEWHWVTGDRVQGVWAQRIKRAVVAHEWQQALKALREESE